jgi:hypothetical protein
MKIACRPISKGTGRGKALLTQEPISFFGGVDPLTGKVIEPGHEIEGKYIYNRVLIFRGGKGSTVGSYVIYQLKMNGLAPNAMVNIRSEPIVAVGAIMAEIPLVDMLPEEMIKIIQNGEDMIVNGTKGYVEV